MIYENPADRLLDTEGLSDRELRRGSDQGELPKYKMGEYTFDSFHEYRRAQEDLKKVDIINANLDVHDPAVAVRLYHALREGEIVFHSPIGDEFTQHIYDLVAEDSEGLLDERLKIETQSRRTRYLSIAGLAVVLVAVGLFGYFGINELSDIYRTRKLAKLQEQVRIEEQARQREVEQKANEQSAAEKSNQESKTKENPFEWKQLIDPSSLRVLPAYREIYHQNEDMAGWIQIEETGVNNPVVQSADNEYYLNHDFDHAESEAGCLFMDYRCDIVNPHTNTIIYGHNMKDGTMFGSLRSYLDEEFFKNHREIFFNTIFEERKYKIVAVCLSEVAYQDEDSFRYYDFIQAKNQQQWDEFVANIKSLSVYDNEIKIEPGNQLLTLSTCNSYIDDGRLFIVAKRVK